jgi:hypothetical protein
MLTLVVFLLVGVIDRPQPTQIPSTKTFSLGSVGTARDFCKKETDAQSLTAGNTAAGIFNVQVVEPEISADDVFALLPMTVSHAVLHPAYARRTEIIRL